MDISNKYKNILITGGAGFVGSNLALKFKKHFPKTKVTCLDNLRRRGSELNLERLKKGGIKFVHGDVRNTEDLEQVEEVDLLIECSAEPSVLAGVNSSPPYVINTNLGGMLNCLELARMRKADVIFLSTSRVYSIKDLNKIKVKEEETRFTITGDQTINGVSARGISEKFPLEKPRSIYGATKLCGEIFLKEYIEQYGIKGVINRCGIIAGPWQMGKIDQGVVALWVANHYFKKDLAYFGFGGKGKQVRDVLDINDLFSLLVKEIKHFNKVNGEVFNIGGGLKNSVSLLELTKLCWEMTGNKLKIGSRSKTSNVDIKVYISDCSKAEEVLGWEPKTDVDKTLKNIFNWIRENEDLVKRVFG